MPNTKFNFEQYIARLIAKNKMVTAQTITERIPFDLLSNIIITNPSDEVQHEN